MSLMQVTVGEDGGCGEDGGSGEGGMVVVDDGSGGGGMVVVVRLSRHSVKIDCVATLLTNPGAQHPHTLAHTPSPKL